MKSVYSRLRPKNLNCGNEKTQITSFLARIVYTSVIVYSELAVCNDTKY